MAACGSQLASPLEYISEFQLSRKSKNAKVHVAAEVELAASISSITILGMCLLCQHNFQNKRSVKA